MHPLQNPQNTPMFEQWGLAKNISFLDSFLNFIDTILIKSLEYKDLIINSSKISRTKQTFGAASLPLPPLPYSDRFRALDLYSNKVIAQVYYQLGSEIGP